MNEIDVQTKSFKLSELYPELAKAYAQKLHIKKDEIPFVRKFYDAAKSEHIEEERAVVSYISTATQDRDGEVLLPEGMITENYEKSGKPVFWGHKYDEPHRIVGQNIWINYDEKTKKGILAKTAFRNTQFADEVYRLYTENLTGQGPVLRAFSVGFIPVEWEDGDNTKGGPKRTYKKWELLEYSLVPIGSNPDAVLLAYQKGWFNSSILKKDLGIEDVPYFQEPAELVDDIIEKQEAELVACQKCGKQFDYSGEPEIAMGWIKCLECEAVINQNGEVAKDGNVSLEGQVSSDGETGEKDEIITKPEETDEYIHIPVRDKEDFVDASFRTIDISEEKGIKAVIGKLKSDPQGSTQVQKYLFKKSGGWTMESAQAWIRDHEKETGEAYAEAEAEQSGEKMLKKPYKERWNKSLSEKFDVDITPERPAARFEYELFTGFLGCKIKDIFKNTFLVPSPLLGTYLLGFEQIVKDFKLKDIRNFTYEGREAPPEYEVVTLNTKRGDKEFLIEGVSFYKADKGNIVLQFEPCWRGINVSFITHLEKREWNRDLMKKVHDWAVANNLLKNEKFALNGEFLKQTEDDWDSLILEPNIKDAIQKTVSYFGEKKENALSRGLLLVGEPGTGKTKTGRVLMNSLDTTFIWMSSRDFKHCDAVGSFVLAFELARDLAPTVLFIEDIDTWLSEYAVDVLKTELDGLKQNKGFLTILTSNYPERLPDALLDRPGRFHHVVDFPLPKAEQRKEMLVKWAGKLSDAVLDVIVNETTGYSGAHMKELVDFANILAAEEKIEIEEALLKSLERLKKQRELIMAIREERRGKALESEDKDIEAGPAEEKPEAKAIDNRLDIMLYKIEEMQAEIAELKEGRVLSTKNRKLISDAITQMKEAIEALERLLTATEPGSDDGEGSETKTVEKKAEVKPTEPGRVEVQSAITAAIIDFFKSGALKDALQELVTDEIDRIRGKVR